MLTDSYGVGGLAGLKNINAYGCLRWIWVVGRKYPYALTMVEYNVFGLTLTKDKYNFYTVLKNTLVLKKTTLKLLLRCCDQS